MTWTQAQLEGFALGATACDDRGAALAAQGLPRNARADVTEVARALAHEERGTRHARVTRALAGMRGVPLDGAAVAADRVPPRALALLAAGVPRSVGERWLAGAPPPRAGYVPEPALRAFLLLLVARAAPAPRRGGAGQPR